MRRRAALIALGQVDGGTVSRDACEIFCTPISVFETKDIYLESQGGLHVLDAQDGLTAFKSHAIRMGGGCHGTLHWDSILAREVAA